MQADHVGAVAVAVVVAAAKREGGRQISPRSRLGAAENLTPTVQRDCKGERPHYVRRREGTYCAVLLSWSM